MADFRFSYNIFGIHSRDDFVQTCRRGERYGYDTVFAADHLGIASPFPALVAAAEAAQRLRVGTLVLNAPFWNPTLHALTQVVVETDDRRAAAEKLATRYGHLMTPDEILQTPFVFIGTIEQMAQQVVHNRDRYGFTYYTVHGPYMDTFAPVIERVRTINH
ncbi:MAG: LLM class flavin-dependent oxidoreductase [Pseudonocardiaceae bacterium]